MKGVSGQVNILEFKDFRDFIYSSDLLDVPVIGKKITWLNTERSIISRLN